MRLGDEIPMGLWAKTPAIQKKEENSPFPLRAHLGLMD
jgi:hypothetical protein